MKKISIALVKGDGAAPEMMGAACKVTSIAAQMHGFQLDFVETPMGWNVYEKFGDTLPMESFKRATEIGTVFFGGVGDPKLDNTLGAEKPEMKPEVRCLLALRKELGLLINVRPVIYHFALAHLANVKREMIPKEGIRQYWTRFLLQDTYMGNSDLLKKLSKRSWGRIGMKLKHQVTGEEDQLCDVAYYTKDAIEEYIREAFKLAKQLGLPLISIDKANIMARYLYWRKIVTRVGAEEFPDVPLTHQLVDSANALLFTPAKLHGVIACGNEHGDILSDGAVGALGSMGLMSSSSINPKTGQALFESGAGTAPTLAGQDKANPIGRILTGALMLRHLGVEGAARAIEESVQKVLTLGYRTGDLISSGDRNGKLVGTSDITDQIVYHL